MGQLIEPKGDGIISPPKVFTQSFLEEVVKKSVENGDVLSDDRLVIIAGVNEQGVKAVVAVKIVDKELMRVRIDGIFQYDWDGDNTVGAKVVFSMR